MTSIAEAPTLHSPTPDISPTIGQENGEILRERKVALVTGGTRGIGAEISRAFALQGYVVIAPHRDEAKHERRVKPLIDEISQAGGEMISPVADITTSDGVQEIVNTLRFANTRVDVLVHNAAGGMEPWADDEYAYQVNAEAKRNLTRAVMEHNAETDTAAGETSSEQNSLTTVDIPSLWSLYARQGIRQLPKYKLVADSKDHGMGLLRETTDTLNQDPTNDVRLVMVAGHGVEDTPTWQMFERMERGLPEEEKVLPGIKTTALEGKLPTMKDMAEAVVRVAQGDYEDGHIEYVRIPNWDQEQVRQEFYMYDDRMRHVDRMVFMGQEGFGHYTVPEDYEANPFTQDRGPMRPISEDLTGEKRAGVYEVAVTNGHTEGHLIQADVMRAVDQVMAGIHGSADLLGHQLSEGKGLRLMVVEKARFRSPAVPGDTLRIHVEEVEDKPLTTTVRITKADPTNPESEIVVSTIGAMTFEEIEAGESDDEAFTSTSQIEHGAQVLGAVFAKLTRYPEVPVEGSTPPDGRVLPLFAGFTRAEFSRVMASKDQEIITHGAIKKMRPDSFIGNADLYVDGEQLATITEITCAMQHEESVINQINAARSQAA